jgi:hypothetical protein
LLNGLHVYDVASIMKAKVSAYLKTDAIAGICGSNDGSISKGFANSLTL